MNDEQKDNHFKGANVNEHLHNISLQKDMILESHAFPKNNLILFTTSFKNILVYLLIISLFFSIAFPHKILSCPLLFSLGLAYALWTTLQRVWQEWSYLELYHRWIQEERKEIESHLDQEIQELQCIYKHKGFQGKLLEQIVDYLSSDVNLLLQSMIEDEFGINLKEASHPLQQGFFMFMGGFSSIVIFLLIYYLTPILYTTLITGGLLIGLNTLSSYLIKNKKIKSSVWSLAIFIFSIMLSIFTYKILIT